MFQVEIDGKTYDAEVTFYTAHLYEMEFKTDLIQDLFGIQTADPSVGFDVEGEGEDAQLKIARIDFTKVSWTAVAKVLWAAIKTADENTPSYTQWMKSTSGANLWLVQEQIGEEVADCFFRAGTPEEDVEEEAE